MPRRASLALLCAAACLIVVPAARADDYVSAFSLAPANKAAGSHSQVDMHVEFGTDDPVRDLAIHLPPGLLGNPNVVPRCSQADFEARSCPANTRVGTTSADAVAAAVIPATATGDVFNLVPGAGEPARLGVLLSAFGGIGQVPPLPVKVSLRPDGGLDTSITGIPATVGGLPTTIKAMDLHLGGGVAPTFMTAPTGCAPATTRLDATTRSNVTHSGTSTFTPTGCSALAFSPSLRGTIDARGPQGAAAQPTLSTLITIPPDNAAASTTTVTLPKRLGLALPVRAVCSADQAARDACPPASQVGTVTAQTPLLAAPLSGPVYTAQIPGQLLPGLRLALGGLVQLRLTGSLEITGGALVTTFSGIPDVPLASLALTFTAGGPLKVVGDPCTGSLLRAAATLTGHNGATATAPARLKVRSCPPLARAVVHRRSRAFTVDLRKGRDTRALRTVKVTLPVRASHLRATADGRRVTPRGKGRTITLRARGAKQVVLRGRLATITRRAIKLSATRANGRHVTLKLKPKRLR
jgi:hypothetical protein